LRSGRCPPPSLGQEHPEPHERGRSCGAAKQAQERAGRSGDVQLQSGHQGSRKRRNDHRIARKPSDHLEYHLEAACPSYASRGEASFREVDKMMKALPGTPESRKDSVGGDVYREVISLLANAR